MWLVFSCGLGSNREDIRRFSFTKNFRKLPWKGPSSEERVPFDSSSFRLNALVTKFKMVAQISTWIAWNWSLDVKTRKGNMHFLRKNSNKKTGLPFQNSTYSLEFSSGTKFLGKWKALIFFHRFAKNALNRDGKCPFGVFGTCAQCLVQQLYRLHLSFVYYLAPSCKTSCGCER